MASKTKPPPVRLGHIAPNGISPSLFGLIERGASRRPAAAKAIRGRVELRFDEDFAPVQISFDAGEILVEDAGGGDGWNPDLVIRGSLPDVVQLASAPLMGGLPKLTDRRGRAALARVAGGRVKIEGSRLLARRLLGLLQL
jgi:hypothetical protein